MKTEKSWRIKVLENTTPPEEYYTDVILDWLKSIRTAPDSRAVHLLVQRIEVTSDNEKTDFNVVSTLESVSKKLVAAIRYHFLLFYQSKRRYSLNAAFFRSERTVRMRALKLSASQALRPINRPFMSLHLDRGIALVGFTEPP